jgi:hypothetical protein
MEGLSLGCPMGFLYVPSDIVCRVGFHTRLFVFCRGDLAGIRQMLRRIALRGGWSMFSLNRQTGVIT